MKQITEDYVSFETAKLLKEKGFDVPISNAYWDNGEEIMLNNTLEQLRNNAHHIVFRPTHQMALKWLREVRKIHIAVNMGCDIDNVNYTFYMPIIVKFNNKSIDYIDPFGEEENEFDSNEEAVEAAILYVLKNLI